MDRFQNKKEEKSGGVSESCFVCQVCGALVVCKMPAAVTAIIARFACPASISTMFPGIGRPGCGGIMDPVGVWVRKNGEWALIHRVPQMRRIPFQPDWPLMTIRFC